MIRVKKPKQPVVVPYSKGKIGQCRLVNSAQSIIIKYNSNPHRYNSGISKFSFYEGVYGHDSVRKSILFAQKNKCCYCEKSIIDGETVEHFRPKKGYKQRKGDPIGKPGYYWLAYNWKNLLYACNKCNQKKENLFPLLNPGSRVKNHLLNPNCSNERPLIVHPAMENPQGYFRFTGGTILAVESKKYIRRRKAAATIETLELNRDALFQLRATHHAEILSKRSAFYAKYNRNRARREFKQYLLSKTKSDQEFSLMVRKVFSKDLK